MRDRLASPHRKKNRRSGFALSICSCVFYFMSLPYLHEHNIWLCFLHQGSWRAPNSPRRGRRSSRSTPHTPGWNWNRNTNTSTPHTPSWNWNRNTTQWPLTKIKTACFPARLCCRHEPDPLAFCLVLVFLIQRKHAFVVWILAIVWVRRQREIHCCFTNVQAGCQNLYILLLGKTKKLLTG